ncbi:hypothetical protein [Microbacterium jiangjiandongii]|uniref:hypothetical protein n=1 Tax=Microbacterium jiangjiandongii TaxID=3049071 RepID=UPI00214A95C2|nr:hypothetical protein [Microbacterium sp. zg.Y843]MCR2816616.1 hypothetical protein [Microbacterium sp. zg.Y843]
MSTQSPTSIPGATARKRLAPPVGPVTRAPAAQPDPDTRYAGAISLAAALGGILLGMSASSANASARTAVRQSATRAAGFER